uniref:DOMON domain-containing protein n=1 Tax=Amphimedon queenslandica TaxID=400682 RepID=A0A1X7UIG5_AMPQE
MSQKCCLKVLSEGLKRLGQPEATRSRRVQYKEPIVEMILQEMLPGFVCGKADLTLYQFNAVLVQDYYWLYWNFSSSTELISFAVKVQTTGWIGFGLSPNGQMPGSDVVIGWVDQYSGPVFHDRYAYGRYAPPIDPIQNWFLTNAEVEDGYTVLEFYRNFITCDDLDNEILLETARIVYSWNDNFYRASFPISISLSKHTTAGSTSINLRGGLPNAPPIPEDSQSFTIAVNEVEIPNYETTYWCTGVALDSSITEEEKYIIRISPYITSGSEPYVHHILVYVCDGLDNSDTGKGGNCDTEISDNMRNCLSQTLIAAWAVGGSDFVYPEHVAFPIGGPNGEQFAVIQLHYNNPEQVSGITDSSGIVFTYIDTRRQYDAGILFLGHAVAPVMIIPPNTNNFKTIGLCSGPCTKTYFPSSGMHIFASMLHTHLAGSGIKLAHLSTAECTSEGKTAYQELQPIENNPHYDFNFQQATHLPQEITVLPGDTLLLECKYNTTGRTGVTLGGESTLQEMCLSFPVYYPRMTELPKCVSLPLFDNMDQFIDNYVPDEHKLSFYSLTPGSSAETLESTMNLLKWTQDQINGYQQYIYQEGLQWSSCGENMGYSSTVPSVSCCSYEAPDVCTGTEPAPCCQRCCHAKCGTDTTRVSALMLILISAVMTLLIL